MQLAIALEEADECVDWLDCLRDRKIRHDAALLGEATQLAAILMAAVKTARKNSKRFKSIPDVDH